MNPKLTHCNQCFSNLAVSSRMRIFVYLKDHGKRTVSEVVEQIPLTQPTISYHLKSMQEAGLLFKERVGKEIYYSVNKDCPTDNRICMLKQMNFAS